MTKRDISSLLADLATAQIYALLVAEVPFFGLPIISSTTKFFINKIMLKALDNTVLAIGFGYIDLSRAAQEKDFIEAKEKYQALLKRGDQDAIKQTSIAFDRAFARAMHLRH